MPELSWVHVNGAPLNPQSRFSNGVYYIPRARKSDEGQYACIGTNPVGTDTRYVQLVVKSKFPFPLEKKCVCYKMLY